MIYSLTGKLVFTDDSLAVIECGGVGFSCYTSSKTLSSLPQTGGSVTLFTHMNVREDAITLFGFSSKNELQLFRMLIGISGVGPKVALAILSELSSNEFILAVASNDSRTITRANGVGPKLAARIVVELKDKLSPDIVLGTSGAEEFAAASLGNVNSKTAEAVAALTTLGYTQTEASVAIGKLDPSLSVEELITTALKSMGKQV